MNLKSTIIIIEDEKSICNFIKTTLSTHGYKALTASSGQEGLSLITSCFPDLILLDLGLPDIDGMEVIRQIRDWSMIPIIVISARTQEQEKVLALDNGADDYITKPFGTPELLARIRTGLRHSHRMGNTIVSSPDPIYISNGLKIDFVRRTVTLNGQEIHLTQIEYKLVSLLAKNSGRVLTYDYIINHIWDLMLTITTIRFSESIWLISAANWKQIQQNLIIFIQKSALATGCGKASSKFLKQTSRAYFMTLDVFSCCLLNLFFSVFFCFTSSRFSRINENSSS